MSSAQKLEDDLRPGHLPSDEDLVREARETVDHEKEAAIRADKDAKSKERYTFELHYVDGRGKVHRGTFTTKILTLGERQSVELVRARYHGGLSMTSFSTEAVELNMMLAHLALSVVERPKWAEDLRSLLDPGIVRAIYAHVVEHEDFFLGWGPSEESGGQKGGGGHGSD